MANDTKQKLARIVAGRVATMTPQPLDAARSTTGQIKGFLTRDTLYRLRDIVAYHQKAPRANAGDRLALILGLCDTYLKDHGADTDARAKAKLASVEDIKAEALMERSRWQAEARYLRDAYEAAKPGVPTTVQEPAVLNKPGPDDKKKATRFDNIRNKDSLGTAIPHTQALAKGERDTNNQEFGFTQATLDLIKKYDLTEAEVLAVKLYTSDDYQYMNPAVANSAARMKDENFGGERWVKWQPEGTPKPRKDDLDKDDYLPAAKQYLASPEGQKHLKQLFEEGSLHGTMVLSALRKLPTKKGTCYRGARLTEEQYQKQYVDPSGAWPPYTLTNPTSAATERNVAVGFALKQDKPAQTVSIVTEVVVQDGRDIGDLSINGRLEKEWLLLPGAVLQTESVDEVTGKKWDPDARCVFVKARQVS